MSSTELTSVLPEFDAKKLVVLEVVGFSSKEKNERTFISYLSAMDR